MLKCISINTLHGAFLFMHYIEWKSAYINGERLKSAMNLIFQWQYIIRKLKIIEIYKIYSKFTKAANDQLLESANMEKINAKWNINIKTFRISCYF